MVKAEFELEMSKLRTDFFLNSELKHVVGTQKNSLNETFF